MEAAGPLRASDAERDRVVAALGRHLADGRLSVDEFAERVDDAYAARTRSELGALVADLPAPDRAPLRRWSTRRCGASRHYSSR